MLQKIGCTHYCSTLSCRFYIIYFAGGTEQTHNPLIEIGKPAESLLALSLHAHQYIYKSGVV
jgi:hypothetical protein